MISQEGNNKKRKHEESSQNSDNDHQLIESDDQNLESVMYEEMKLVNDQLISLATKVPLLDTRYFMYNGSMVDEFMGNIHEFLNQYDRHRRIVSCQSLSSDNLFNIFQFLDSKTIINKCRYVNTIWKQAADRCDLKVIVGKANLNNLINNLDASSLKDTITPSIVNATSLRILKNVIINSYQILTKVVWKNLTSLDISDNTLYKKSLNFLKQCKMPNLTELNLSHVQFIKVEAVELFKSDLLKGIKKLDISNVNAIEDCQMLNQITHLTCSSCSTSTQNLELAVKDRDDLEYLHVKHFKFSPILTSGIYTKLSTLILTRNYVSNEEYVSLFLCKNLPSLRTIFCTGQTNDSTVVNFPPNCQSYLSNLTLSNFDTEPFPSLIDHCPNLKSLSITNDKGENDQILNYLNSSSLSNLESLHIDCCDESLTIIFTNPIYSNLKQLQLEGKLSKLDEGLLLNCNNLVNLRQVRTDCELVKKCVQSLKTHPIFSKVQLK